MTGQVQDLHTTAIMILVCNLHRRWTWNTSTMNTLTMSTTFNIIIRDFTTSTNSNHHKNNKAHFTSFFKPNNITSTNNSSNNIRTTSTPSSDCQR